MSPGTSPELQAPPFHSSSLPSHTHCPPGSIQDPSSCSKTAATLASVAAVPRRAHAKSRSGCRTCKQRKIKCDETRPSCRNCIRHAVTCDFVQDQLASNRKSRSASSGSLRRNGEQTHIPGSLNMTDLELIHNFVTFTHTTLSSDYAMRQMLRTTAVRMAFECEFLMRAILALSAMHLAHFRHDSRNYYVSVGMEHHWVASRLAIEVMKSDVQNLTQQRCECLHLFSVLTMFFSLGTPKSEHDSLIIGDSIFPLTMLRSAEPILRFLNPQTYKGVLAPLFAFGSDRWQLIWRKTQPLEDSIMFDLQETINKSCTDHELLHMYNDIIDKLRRVLSILALDASPSTTPASTQTRLEAWDIFVCQWDAAKDLVPLLRGPEPRQEAVVIYAHFLIMLKKLENQWWLEGWATHMMERVWASLNEEHRLWIQWPIEELGWVPPSTIGDKQDEGRRSVDRTSE